MLLSCLGHLCMKLSAASAGGPASVELINEASLLVDTSQGAVGEGSISTGTVKASRCVLTTNGQPACLTVLHEA